MSLKVRTLTRVARLAVLVVLGAMLPAAPAHADSFGTYTAINSTNSGTQYWIGNTTSYDGNIMYALAQYGYVYKSSDSGTTWSRLATSGARYWTAIATNDSGTVVYAAAGAGDSIYKSTDSGATWTATPGTTTCTWTSITTNASGTIAASVCGSGYVYVTYNSGASWQAVSGVGTTAKSVAISGDGTRLALNTNDGTYLGTYSASTWTFAPFKNLYQFTTSIQRSVSISRDGQKVIAVGSDGYVHLTRDFGTTWETSTAQPNGYNRGFSAIHISGDGTRIVAGDANGPIYYSTNYGVAWQLSTTGGTGAWSAISSDYSGTRWVATINASGGFSTHGIYASINSAANFTAKRPADGFTRADKIEASQDGSVIAAINYYGDVWISRDSGSTWSIASLQFSSSYLTNCIAMSSDGSVILIGSKRYLYRSTDSGQTFNIISSGIFASVQDIASIALSGDGTKAALVISASGIYLSNDGGQNFSQTETTVLNGTTYTWRDVTMTLDGTKLAIGTSGSNAVITSTDSGVNWALTSSPAAVYTYMKSAGDGSVLIAYGTNPTQPIVSRNWGTSWSNLGTLPAKNFLDGLSISYDGSLIVAANYLGGAIPYSSTNFGATFTSISGTTAAVYTSVKVTGNKNYVLFAPQGLQISRMAVIPPTPAQFAGISLGAPNISFRTQVTLTATISTTGADGKVTFFANGKKIPGCIKVATTSLVATCSWKPMTRGAVTLSAVAYPTDTNYASGSAILPVAIGNRSGRR